MSTKENDLYYEGLQERLDELGGVILEGESLEEAVRKEEIIYKMHGCGRTELAAKIDKIEEANQIAFEAKKKLDNAKRKDKTRES